MKWVGFMENKKIKLIISVSLLGVILLLGLFSFSDIKYSTKEGLSYEEKKKDAKYLMDFIESTYPYFEELKEKTETNIIKDRNRIISSISKTSSDQDFFNNIMMLSRKFIYGYVAVNINGETSGNGFTYLDKDLELNSSSYRDKAIKGKEKWEPIFLNYFQNSFVRGNVTMHYIDGDYYIVASQNPEVHIGDKVIKIDGTPIDDYVKNLPEDKYYKEYDETYQKDICPYSLYSLKDKSSKMKLTLKTSSGEDKDIDMLPYDENSPLLEDGFKIYSDSNFSEELMKDKENRKFYNSFNDGEIVVLNFSAFKDLNDHRNSSERKNELLSLINKSDYLVFDVRSGESYDNTFLDILGYTTPKDIEYSNYRVIKKNKINDEFVEYYRNSITPFISEITSPIESLEKSYPLSDYHIFKEKKFEIKGQNQYKGKVFIFSDATYFSEYSRELLKTIIDNDLATVISNSNLRLTDLQYFGSEASAILPNSNLRVTVSVGKSVDDNGTFIGKHTVKPQIIIQRDTNEVLEMLRRGEGISFDLKSDKRYTSDDKYFNELLKLIK